VIVVLLSTWGTAAADRAEALRRERRSAYAEFLGRAHSCEAFRMQTGVIMAELVAKTSGPRAWSRRLGAILASQQRLCHAELNTAASEVRLLADSKEIEDAAWELQHRTIGLPFSTPT
jgi:hypothetical protein